MATSSRILQPRNVFNPMQCVLGMSRVGHPVVPDGVGREQRIPVIPGEHDAPGTCLHERRSDWVRNLGRRAGGEIETKGGLRPSARASFRWSLPSGHRCYRGQGGRTVEPILEAAGPTPRTTRSSRSNRGVVA